jgi:uncharacterized protein (TIGR01244 family)
MHSRPTWFPSLVRLCVGCCLAMIVLAAPAGCTKTQDHESVGWAKPVTDLEGFHNIYQDDGIYFAGQPTEQGLRDAAARGVNVVINLRPDAEMEQNVAYDEPSVVKELGMEYVTIPVTPASFSSKDADLLAKTLSHADEPVLIHCGSSNRVGALWALYLNRHRNLEIDDAIERGKKAGMRSEKLAELVRRHQRNPS